MARIVIPTVALAAILVTLVAASNLTSRSDVGGPSPHTLIGSWLPDIELKQPDGGVVSLHEHLGSQPAFLFLVTAEDCLGCGAFGDELRLLAREQPGHKALLIGIGAGAEETMGYARRHRVEALYDERGSLQDALGVYHAPIFMATSGDGRILLVDGRTGPAARSWPASKVIGALRQELAGTAVGSFRERRKRSVNFLTTGG